MTPLRIPSLDAAVVATGRTVRRFPDVLALACTAAACALRLVDSDGEHPALEAALAASVAGIPLLLAIALAGERRAWSVRTALVWRVAATALLVAAWRAWPDWTPLLRALRFGVALPTFLLAATVSAFPRKGDGNAFWHFNRVALQRLLVTVLFAGALFLGLATALAALQFLFGVDVPAAAYGRLWVLDTFIFGVGFFLAGLPDPPDALAEAREVPEGLRKFAQYVLLPLVVVYLALLTAYLAKVLLTRQWPSGWIGTLVSAVAVAGMLAWVLVHPLEQQPAHRWVRPFTRGFFLALLPSIGMLWVALGKRVAQYGLTGRRVIALAGALWLTVMVGHYLLTRSRGIRRLPFTLALMGAVLLVGPLSAVSLAERSQRGRAEGVLRRHGMLQRGRWTPAPAAGMGADAPALASAVRYLAELRGALAFDGVVPDSVLRPAGSDTSAVIRRDLGTRVLRHLGGDALAEEAGIRVPAVQSRGVHTLVFDQQAPVAVEGFTWTVRGMLGPEAAPVRAAPGYLLGMAADSAALELRRAGADGPGGATATADTAVVLRLPLDSAFRVVVAHSTAGASAMAARRTGDALPRLMVEGRAPGVRLRVLVEQLTVEWRGTAGRLRYLEAIVLFTTDSTAPAPR